MPLGWPLLASTRLAKSEGCPLKYATSSTRSPPAAPMSVVPITEAVAGAAIVKVVGVFELHSR